MDELTTLQKQLHVILTRNEGSRLTPELIGGILGAFGMVEKQITQREKSND